MSLPEAADKLTVNVALAALSSAVITSSIDNAGGLSSSVIVKTPVASLIVALDGLDKVKVTVSLFSSVVSAKTGTLNVPDVAPALIVKVPLVAV
jgi:hypothetical protein